VALSQLSGAALASALEAIYAPLVAPAALHQVRTNEFLVGPGDSFTLTPQTAWELREWRLGADGQLHLAPSKQALDPASATTPAFGDWLAQNRAALLDGTATLPDAFVAVTSTEDGSALEVLTAGSADGVGTDRLNQLACAGCHTTVTHSAFVHVGERFRGTGRAQLSEFLRAQLPGRAQHLYQVSLGRLDQTARATARPVH
jgi:hypothetical protein